MCNPALHICDEAGPQKLKPWLHTSALQLPHGPPNACGGLATERPKPIIRPGFHGKSIPSTRGAVSAYECTGGDASCCRPVWLAASMSDAECTTHHYTVYPTTTRRVCIQYRRPWPSPAASGGAVEALANALDGA